MYLCQDAKRQHIKNLFARFGSCVWDPRVWSFKKKLKKKVQNRAARFVNSIYCFETGSMTGILEKLRWDSQANGERQSCIKV